ncbi:hypothetical protein MGALJ_30310 [Mycobacterium gallinarum]|uniref:Secreted protein n=1 Tax=Mycobacterium gallinarum TaxID=39689 RepID=A0A9W4BFM8_9MYCO|nr:hypothetical protein MGALJ_30310 [Mycobacterium gallinarum]
MAIKSRALIASTMLAFLAIGSGASTDGVASASPADGSVAGCEYALSRPELVIIPGGGRGVRANMTPTTCASNATPTDVTVCVQAPGGASQCKQTPGWSLAEIILPAPSSGAYTATGTGCWLHITEEFRPDCRTVGPVALTT